MEREIFRMPNDFSLARLVNDNDVYFLHQIGGYAKLAEESIPSEEARDMISFAALDTMKIFIPLTLGARYACDEREIHLLARLLDPMSRLLDLVQGRLFEGSLAKDRKKAVNITNEMLVAYYQLREYYQSITVNH